MVRICVFIILLFQLTSCIRPHTKPQVHIGVLAYRGVDKSLSRWSATVQYIQSRIPQYNFVLVPLDLSQMHDAVVQKELEFVLTNTGNYFELKSYGLTPLSSLKNLQNGKAYSEFGSVIFTHKDNNEISTIEDLRGKSFAAVSRSAFGGFQMAWRECMLVGVDPFQDFSEIHFTDFPQDKVVLAVLDKTFDVGTVRTGVIERMVQEQLISSENIKVINQQSNDAFPFRLSTRLYPEWPFLVSEHTPADLTGRVQDILLNIKPASKPAEIGRYVGWSNSNDLQLLFNLSLDELMKLQVNRPIENQVKYKSIDELMKELKIGPYKAE